MQTILTAVLMLNLAQAAPPSRENPDDIEAYQQRVLAHIGANRPDEALADAQKAVELDPDDVDSRFVRAKALILSRQYDLAIKDLNFVLKRGDERDETQVTETYYQRGLAHAGQGNAASAVKDFSRAIHKTPYRIELYEARAAAYETLGKVKKAQRDRETAEHRGAIPPSLAEERTDAQPPQGNDDGH
jgi:tetratricopeptide (TPR) repeat protein